MGKNNKVLLDNGKQASSSMQLYWNKAKQIEKKKQEQRKKDFKERNQSEIKNKEAGQKQSNGEDEEGNFMSREAMNNIMKEKERRRQGQYSSKSEDVLTEANILNAQKALTNKTIKIPGYSSDFISAQQIERNKQEIEKRSLMAQAARDRKEQREKKEKEGGDQSAQPIQKPEQKPQQNPQQANKPPFNNNQNFKHQHHQNFQNRQFQNRQKEQETSDPLFKVTEQEDYNPVQDMIKQQQLQQQRQQNLNQQSNNNYQPPPPPNMPPPPFGMMPPPPSMLPPLPPKGMFPPPPNIPPPPNMPPPPQMHVQMPYYPPYQQQQQPQISQQNKNNAPPPPPMLVPKPIVVEGESTVKKSKIDLTQKKQQFVPRSLVGQTGSGNNSNKPESKQVKQPEALGGNIQNVSQAPAPKPFLEGQNPFISNPNNQDLLKQFLQDIENISKKQNNESSQNE